MFFSDDLGPGYYPLQLTVSCMVVFSEGKLDMFHYDRDNIRLSLKMTTPSGTAMNDVTPDIFVHKAQPDPDEGELACW